MNNTDHLFCLDILLKTKISYSQIFSCIPALKNITYYFCVKTATLLLKWLEHGCFSEAIVKLCRVAISKNIS